MAWLTDCVQLREALLELKRTVCHVIDDFELEEARRLSGASMESPRLAPTKNTDIESAAAAAGPGGKDQAPAGSPDIMSRVLDLDEHVNYF